MGNQESERKTEALGSDVERGVMRLYHATTERKAHHYRETGYIRKPVRGFTTVQAANVIHFYWVMLRSLESKAHSSDKILDKDTVEAGYRLWNRVTGDNLRPVWMTHTVDTYPAFVCPADEYGKFAKEICTYLKCKLEDLILVYPKGADEIWSYIEDEYGKIFEPGKKEYANACSKTLSIGHLNFGTWVFKGNNVKCVAEQNASPIMFYINKKDLGSL